MKNLFLLAMLLTQLFAYVKAMPFTGKDLESDETLWSLYERWRSYYTASRVIDHDEMHNRFNVFKENAEFILEFNKRDAPYKLELNKFGDMTSDEFRRAYAGSKIHRLSMQRGSSRATEDFEFGDAQNLPPSIDWREKGAVTAVKDQGMCGGCWAFSTVAAVEGINQIKTKKLISLSEQELIDCDTSDNNGCNGGLMEYAFDFIKEKGGITTEKNYPYVAKDQTCNTTMEKYDAVVIDGHKNVPENDEDSLMKVVANQPVSAAIEASGQSFQFYYEGVFDGDCGNDLDHGVAIVGYGTTQDGTKYWIVKNSWGSDWGERGYIRMARGVSDKEGLCGLAMLPSYPIKTSPNPTKKKDEL